MTNINHALLFPGQGSQFLGMLSTLSTMYPVVKATFEEASEILGYDLWLLTQQGPLVDLNQTVHTQVAMLTADVAVFNVWLSALGQVPPAYFVGHSLGEYAALVCAKVLSFSDAVRLVRTRATLMQETIPLGQGAMAAIIGLEDDQVRDLCEEVSSEGCRVEPANYNAIGQVVIAGHTNAVRRAMDKANALGAKIAMEIPVSVPCHCALLRPASEQFLPVLQSVQFSKPMFTVMSTIDLTFYEDVAHIPHQLARQLHAPVQFVGAVQTLHRLGVTQAFECGPGKILAGLVKRIERTLRVMNLDDPAWITQAQVMFEKVKA